MLLLAALWWFVVNGINVVVALRFGVSFSIRLFGLEWGFAPVWGAILLATAAAGALVGLIARHELEAAAAIVIGAIGTAVIGVAADLMSGLHLTHYHVMNTLMTMFLFAVGTFVGLVLAGLAHHRRPESTGWVRWFPPNAAPALAVATWGVAAQVAPLFRHYLAYPVSEMYERGVAGWVVALALTAVGAVAAYQRGWWQLGLTAALLLAGSVAYVLFTSWGRFGGDPGFNQVNVDQLRDAASVTFDEVTTRTTIYESVAFLAVGALVGFVLSKMRSEPVSTQ